MITHLTAPEVRAARTIAALVAALTLAVLLAQEIGASTINSMHDRAKAQSDACAIDGGKATKEYEFSKGSTEWTSITMKCKGGKSDGWTCVNTPSRTDCTRPLTRPEEPPFGDVPGGGTNAPASEDDPRTGDIVIVGTGTYAQDDGQPTTDQTAPVDTVEDEGPTTVEPDETEVVAEPDDEITTVEYRRIRGGDEEQP